MQTELRSLLLASAVGLALGGCATTNGSLADSAERLERVSYAFQRDANDDGNSRELTLDARELADEARDFQRTLSDRRSDDRDVQQAFREVSRSYHSARDEVERSRGRDADRDFATVTDAYLDLERAMNGVPRRDRLAREDY